MQNTGEWHATGQTDSHSHTLNDASVDIEKSIPNSNNKDRRKKNTKNFSLNKIQFELKFKTVLNLILTFQRCFFSLSPPPLPCQATR